MSLDLYFLRHGETTLSQTGSYCGAIDAELTPEGVQMAQAFANAHCSLSWQAVYVSPMKRTIATATPFCQAIGLEMQLRDGLREMNFGLWEGQAPESVKQQFEQDYVRWLTEPAWNPPTGGETAVEVASRANLVLSEIESSYTDGCVLVVSHKTTIRIMLCNLLGIDLGRYRDRIDMPVASVSVVQFEVHGPLLKRLGDRSFMNDQLRNRPGT